MRKTIGVTGASGFIGKRLIDKLIAEKYSVVALIRSNEKFPKGVKTVVGDFEDKNVLQEFLQSVDVVVHLAARQVPPDDLLFESNVTLTNVLIERMIEYPIQHLIYLSTAAVYGDREDILFDEEDPCSPTTSYGLTKYLGEIICRYWQQKTNGIVTILRPFNVYGEGSTKGVIYNMLNNIKNNRPIEIYGDGNQTRDFVYVDDLVNALLITIEKQPNEFYNIGSGTYTSLLELADYIKSIFPGKVNVDFREYEKDKPKNISYSIEKVQKELGWLPKVQIEEGLKKIAKNG